MADETKDIEEKDQATDESNNETPNDDTDVEEVSLKPNKSGKTASEHDDRSAQKDDDALDETESEETDPEEEEEPEEEEPEEEDPEAAIAAAEAALRAAKEAAKKKKKKSTKRGKDEDKKEDKKKEETKTEEEKHVLSDASSSENHTSSKPEPSKEPRVGDVVGGVFTPNQPYKEPAELDDSERFHDPMQIPAYQWFIAVIVVVLLGGAAIYAYAEKPEDIKDVVAGTFKAKKIAERERIEEEKRLAALKAQNKYGLLMIQGNPQYATILFDGKPRYGITSSGQWRALNLHGNVPIKNLNIKDEFEVQIQNPGFKPLVEKITQGSWQKNQTGDDYGRILGANLEPVSPEHKMEFDQRLAPDTSTEFFGTVTINSTPPGAYVIFDNHPLKDASGKDLVTPVTFEANYVFDEKTKTYQEVKVKVDTVLDLGHTIEVGIKYPNTCTNDQSKCVNDDGCCPAGPKCNVATDTDCKIPVQVEVLQRQNWTCTFDEEKKTEAYQAILDGKAESRSIIQEACAYSYTLNADLKGIKKFAQKQEEERLKVLRLNAELSGEPLDSQVSEGDPTEN